MSDLQSVPSKQKIHTPESETKLVDAYAILQKVLQQLCAPDRGQVVLRCDILPFVQIPEADLESVFSILLGLILQKKTAAAKLFLHIHCATEVEAIDESPGLKPYTIQLSTNIQQCNDWLSENEQQTMDARAMLQKNGGELSVNQLKNDGCVFSLFLAGKMN